MKLIGSTTSPFVRRIRLQLAEKDYEFMCVNIFSEEGQAEVAKYTTTGRIPLWVEDDRVIWDSLLIADHLSDKPLSLDVKKDLILINEMTDAGVQLFQLRKFETDAADEGVFSKNNLKRIGAVLDYFESNVSASWTITAQWLFCTLDWMDFREVYPWRDDHPKLVAFHAASLKQAWVAQTDPRTS